MNIRKTLYIVKKELFPDYTYRKRSYSQCGEDLVLLSFMGNRKKGFYVDVGAHHPLRFSNTAIFYQKGWCGINIEPTPTSAKTFKQYRKRDINLNIGIANKEEALTFYMFNEPAYNSFNKELSLQRNELHSSSRIIKEIPVKTYRLADVLDQYLPEGQKIDFLTTDVEGLDYEVLQSNNWQKYAPDFILVESSIDGVKHNDDIYRYLNEMHYQPLARTKWTSIFKKL
jgi:FkbM family methyltransferase